MADIQSIFQQMMENQQRQPPQITAEALSKRFQPTMEDTGTSIYNTAQSYLNPNFKPQTVDQAAESRVGREIMPLNALFQLKKMQRDVDAPYSDYGKIMDDLNRGLITPELAQQAFSKGDLDSQLKQAQIDNYRAKASGQTYVDPVTGETIVNRKMSPTEQKEFFDTSDIISASQNAKNSLSGALNTLRGGATNNDPKPFSGWGAETFAGMNRVPGLGLLIDDKRATATTDYTNQITEQALSNLKATFGGNPTEGERQVLLKLQALPSYTPQEQEAIINNALELADRRIKFNSGKLNAIQTGNYAGFGRNLAQTPSPMDIDENAILQELQRRGVQ